MLSTVNCGILLTCGYTDDKSAVNGTREDLLKFDTSYDLSISKFGPVSAVIVMTHFNSNMHYKVCESYFVA